MSQIFAGYNSKNRKIYVVICLLLTGTGLGSLGWSVAPVHATSALGFVPLTITNPQSVVTGNYQQPVTIDSTSFPNLINSNWSNVEFQYPNGTAVPSWIESGNSNSSTDTVIWLRLGSIPASGSQEVDMIFMPLSENILSPTGSWGEAPWLSSSFGQFDNGVRVFNLYANFQGSSLQATWSLQGAAAFQGGDTAYGGVELVQNQGYQEGAIVYQSPITEQNIIVEASAMYYSPGGNEADDLGVGFYSQGPTSQHSGWNPQSTAGYYAPYEFWSGGPPALFNGSNQLASASSQTMPNSGVNYLYTKTVITQSSVSMNFLTRTTGMYQNVPSISAQNVVSYNGNVANSYSTFYVGGATGGASSYQYVYWIRILGYEQTMPTVTVGSVRPSADFGISAPTAITGTAGSSQTSTITFTSVNGFAGNISLNVVTTSGLTANFSPTTVELTANSVAYATMTLSAVATGSYSATVTGVSGSVQHSETTQVTMTPNTAPDFAITLNPSPIIVQQGSSTNSVLTIASKNGFQGTVSLSVYSSGAYSSLSESSVSVFTGQPGTSTLTVTASLDATSGSYSLTISGTNGTISHQLVSQILLSQAAPGPDFALTTTQMSMTLDAGVTGNSVITVSPINGFTGTVKLLASVSQSGLSCSLSFDSISGGSGSPTLSCAGSAWAYSVSISGTSGSLHHSISVTVTVQDYSVSVSSLNLQTDSGTRASATITVTPQDGFDGPVTLGTTVNNNGLSCTVTPATLPAGSGSSTLSCGGTEGSYTVTVTTISGSLSHPAQVSVSVTSVQQVISPNILGMTPIIFYGIVGASLVIAAAATLLALRLRRKVPRQSA